MMRDSERLSWWRSCETCGGSHAENTALWRQNGKRKLRHRFDRSGCHGSESRSQHERPRIGILRQQMPTRATPPNAAFEMARFNPTLSILHFLLKYACDVLETQISCKPSPRDQIHEPRLRASLSSFQSIPSILSPYGPAIKPLIKDLPRLQPGTM